MSLRPLLSLASRGARSESPEVSRGARSGLLAPRFARVRETESEGIVSLKVLLFSLYEGNSLSLASLASREARESEKRASSSVSRKATPLVMRARERETKDVTKRAR